MKKKHSFDPVKFWEFCAKLKIQTKELGEIRLTQDSVLGTQRYFIDELKKGLDEGVHEFVILKGRQVAISTICIALDLYWLGKYSGITGALVTHNEETRDMFRVTFDMYSKSLPMSWKVDFKINNRTQMVTKRNRNRLAYMVAGTRKNSKLGKGTALTFAHMTECSEYGDEEGLASLKAAFSQENPNRLFIMESTAQGYNHYYDTWLNAQTSTSKRAIFIGWWRNHFYTKKKESAEYQVYWDGKMTPVERVWVREVKQLYDFDITDEQLAWWRWQLAEEQKDELLMFQNFPPTEHYAFVKSGSQFFSGARINEEFKLAMKDIPKNYRFVLGDNFEDTELVESSERLGNLKVWESPQPDAYYALGGDPAWGSSEWKDGFVTQVYRCYSDRMEQVAEFWDTECSPFQFAWVLCYLGGAYLDQAGSVVMLNLELNGPGMAVWQEIQNLKRLTIMSRTEAGKKIFKVVSRLENYMYKRQDSFGAPTGYHTQSSTREKERMLNNFRDGFERGLIKVRSKACIDEMRKIIREDGFIGADGRDKDDRVLASGLSTITWTDYLRARLVSAIPGGLTYEAAKTRAASSGKWQPTNIGKFIQERLA